MNESGTGRSEAYSRLRNEFDTLAIEDKAIFLLESTLSTLVRGIEAFGHMVGEELDKAFRRADEAAAEEEFTAGTTPPVTPEPPADDIPGPRFGAADDDLGPVI
jgi:hypothetical protein